MLAAFAFLTMAAAPASAAEPNWAKVPGKDMVLFYPASFNWERLFTPGYHTGQRGYAQGKNCFACHGGIDEGPMGMHLVKAERAIEPRPIANKPPFVKAQVKASHDADTMYVRLEFDPGEQPSANMDKEFETKVTLMFDDGSIREATRAGCWIACHSNNSSMPYVTTEKTKYLPDTHTSMSSSRVNDIMRPAPEIADMRAKGKFMEYWQARLNTGKPAIAVDGTVLEKRAENPKAAVTATATRTKTNAWVVTFARKLKAGEGYKDFVPGKTYTLGVSVHAGYTTQRFHYVSFERTLVLDAGKADLVAAATK